MELTINRIKTNCNQNILKYNNAHPNNKSTGNHASMNLSYNDTLGRSIVSFRSNESNAINLEDKTVEQLKELKRLYNSNQEEIDAKRKQAEANLEKIAAWNSDLEYRKQMSAAEAEIDRKNYSRFWNPFKCKAIRSKYYDEYHKKLLEITKLRTREEVDKTILQTLPYSRKQTELLIKQIDSMIKQKEELEKQKNRLRGLDAVQASINEMSNKSGGLNDRIAGYEYEKDEINRMFVEPMAKSIDDPNVKVPAAVLLHGATGTGKTTFINAIGAQAQDYAKVVDLSQDVSAEDFTDEIKRQLEDARARYFETDDKGKPQKIRTILLINEAERFLSMTPKEAVILYGNDIFDDMDMEYMEKYGQSADYINNFKTLLDTCSEIPKSQDDVTRGAMTIFITSNYPHLIHPDLLSRDGKMPFIAINPAKPEDISAVLKHYFKKAHNFVEKVKQIENPEDVNHIVGISKKAKNNIKKMMITGRIDELNVDYENIPYDNFAREYKPSTKKGAFSNDCFRKLAEKSLEMYLENPEHSYDYYYVKNIIKEDAPKNLPNGTIIPSGRDINPNRYIKFVKIYNMLSPSDVDERNMLIQMEKLGCLDEKARKRLNYIRIKEESELKNLIDKENKNIITESERTRLKELRELQEADKKINEHADDEDENI